METLGTFGSLARKLFGEVNKYGFNEIVRMYSGYPSSLPLSANIYHGWYIHPPRASDLNGFRHTVLVFNKRQKEEWEQQSRRPVHIFGAPFVHYRRLMNITRRFDATGTIVYPGHDATSNDFVFDQRRLCEQLKRLDQKYKPITISCTEMDILQGKDRIYRDHGFDVVCPGPSKTVGFVRNVYNALARHKYSCGNHVGTNILYAIEMGVPFFFIGDIGHGVNRNTGEKIVYQRTPEQIELINRIVALFSEPVDEITEAQRSTILPECGMDDCVPPNELRRILFNAFFWHDLPRVIVRAPRSISRRLFGSAQ